MKLADMANLFEGLAATLEPFLGKTDAADLRVVGACFRQFPDDTVANFCKYITQARQAKPAAGRSGGRDESALVEDLIRRIEHYRTNHKTYEYAAIDALAAEVGKLKVANIKKVGEAVGCPLRGSKTEMTSWLGSWLTNLKASADHANFTLSRAGVS
jgi:hypothetical protein